MIVGIDSMILVYAQLVPSKGGQGSQENKELTVRAKLLMQKLATDKPQATILLPTIAIAEVLVKVPKHQRGPLIALLQESFVCPPLDLPAAAIAADLWSRHKDVPHDLNYANRQILKADTLIVASVFAAGATDFYSHDAQCRALAGLLMKAHDLPMRGGDLFTEGDIRRGEL